MGYLANMRQQTYFCQAKDYLHERQDCSGDSSPKRHVAFLIRGGKTLAMATNSSRTRIDRKMVPSMHAEVAVCQRILKVAGGKERKLHCMCVPY